MTVSTGQTIPDFSAQATSGQTVSSAALRGKAYVLYFYPKDNTPGCTTEGQDFRDLHADFTAANTLVFGVSKDSLRTHENFKAKQQFPFELISDPDESLCQVCDVIQKKMLYGKEYMGIERTTLLIDAEGVVRREWRKVKVKGHAAEVLQAAQQLNG